jgi:hypothetical protein
MGDAARACSFEKNHRVPRLSSNAPQKNVRPRNKRMSNKSGLAAVARQDNARALNREKHGQGTERSRRWPRAAARFAYDHRVALGTTLLGGAALLYTKTKGQRAGHPALAASAPAPVPPDTPPLQVSPPVARAAPAPAPLLPLPPPVARVAPAPPSRCSRFRRPSRCSRSRSRSRCRSRCRSRSRSRSHSERFVHASRCSRSRCSRSR